MNRNDRKEVQDKEWPFNLIRAIGLEVDDPLEHIPSEMELYLAMCVSTLTDREQYVIHQRYFEQKTLKEVGQLIGTQQERARQIEAKALRKLRHPRTGYLLQHGAKAYVDKRVEEKVSDILSYRQKELEEEYKKKMVELQVGKVEAEKIDITSKLMATPIEELELSVRSYNCLKRRGCNTIDDVVRNYPTFEEAITIRNLGRKSLEEISWKFNSMGIKWPVHADND